MLVLVKEIVKISYIKIKFKIIDDFFLEYIFVKRFEFMK